MRASSLLFLAALLTLLGLFSLAACTADCTSGCQSTFNDCVDRSPAGAARAECSAQYQACMNECEASQDIPSKGPLACANVSR